jgi:hypothetical protein
MCEVGGISAAAIVGWRRAEAFIEYRSRVWLAKAISV